MLTSRTFEKPNSDMDQSNHVLRLQLEGRWYAEDLFACMDSLTTLYDLRLVLQAFRDGAVKPDKRSSKDRRHSKAPLTEVNRRSGQEEPRRVRRTRTPSPVRSSTSEASWPTVAA